MRIVTTTTTKALGKLRVIESEGPRANEMVPLYRGMRGTQVPPSFYLNGRGGTELAPMSSTSSLKVAMEYAASEQALTPPYISSYIPLQALPLCLLTENIHVDPLTTPYNPLHPLAPPLHLHTSSRRRCSCASWPRTPLTPP